MYAYNYAQCAAQIILNTLMCSVVLNTGYATICVLQSRVWVFHEIAFRNLFPAAGNPHSTQLCQQDIHSTLGFCNKYLLASTFAKRGLCVHELSHVGWTVVDPHFETETPAIYIYIYTRTYMNS